MNDAPPFSGPMTLLDEVGTATTAEALGKALARDVVGRLGWSWAVVRGGDNLALATAGATPPHEPRQATLAIPLGAVGAVLHVSAGRAPEPEVIEATHIAARITGLAFGRLSTNPNATHAASVLERLLHFVPSIVVLTRGPDHVVEAVNDAFIRALGKGRDAVVGRRIRDALPGMAAQGFFTIADRVYQTGERYLGNEVYAEFRYEDRTVPAWHNVLYEPVPDAEGRIEGVFMFAVDVTGLVQARLAAEAALGEVERIQAHLIHTQKMESIGRMSSGIAHDFNNLLSVILGNLSLITDGLLPGDPLIARAESARKAVDQATRLTLELMGLAGRGQFAPRPVDLRECLEDALNLLRPVMPRGVTLRARSGSAPVIAPADPAQMLQVITTLVLQAAESLEGGVGTVGVNLHTRSLDQANPLVVYGQDRLDAGLYAVIEVQDTGRGMSEATCARLFDPFFRTEGTGRGLGLASLLATVRSHGGGVRVESHIGVGTRFEVFLPLERAAPTRRPAAAVTTGPDAAAPNLVAAPPPSRTVLVVDDEALIRELLTWSLAPVGCGIVEAADLAAALVALDTAEVIVLDLTLPDATGAEAYQAVRARAPGVPIILCSGLAEEEARALTGVGAEVPFLRKPFDVREAARLVRAALDR